MISDFYVESRRNKERKKFEQGIDYTNSIKGYPIIMKYFIEIDREVLRGYYMMEEGSSYYARV